MKGFYFSKFNFLLESMKDEQKIAVVPGSFKPPHKGHYEMIKHYSKLVGPTGRVLVLISAPSAKSQRKTSTGKVITPELAKNILDIYCKSLGNVEVEVTEGSPVKACYDIGNNFDSGILIFGCSKKDDDIKRFKNIKSYVEEHNPNLIVLDPLTTAVDVTTAADGVVSATDFRRVYGDPKEMMQFLPDHLTDGEKKNIIQLMLQ